MYYNFSPDLPEPFNVIHPLQLKKVQKLLLHPIPDEVDYIFLFGGSLDLACDLSSDLDLYVVSEIDSEQVYEVMHKFLRPMRLRADILVDTRENFLANAATPATVEGRMKNKGICIYAKTPNNIT